MIADTLDLVPPAATFSLEISGKTLSLDEILPWTEGCANLQELHLVSKAVFSIPHALAESLKRSKLLSFSLVAPRITWPPEGLRDFGNFDHFAFNNTRGEASLFIAPQHRENANSYDFYLHLADGEKLTTANLPTGFPLYLTVHGNFDDDLLRALLQRTEIEYLTIHNKDSEPVVFTAELVRLFLDSECVNIRTMGPLFVDNEGTCDGKDARRLLIISSTDNEYTLTKATIVSTEHHPIINTFIEIVNGIFIQDAKRKKAGKDGLETRVQYYK